MGWLGIRAGALNLLIPVAEVAEVLTPTPFTLVPLTQPWFRGLQNVRGTLYSVIDLPALCGYAPVPAQADARLLLLNPQRIRNTALLVNRLSGMQLAAALSPLPADEEAVAGPPRKGLGAALGAPWRDAQQAVWHELDPAALVALPEFLDAAALPAQGVLA